MIVNGSPDAVTQDKRQLLDYLRKRNPDMNSVQFRNDIREGRRVQACLRLESKGLMESEDFAKEYGLMFRGFEMLHLQ